MADAEFVKHSSLEISVPEASDLTIEQILEKAAGQEESLLTSSIPQRSLLFFDEILPVYAILRTSYKDEEFLKKRIPRLAITLEAHAITSPNIATPTGERPASSGSQARDVIWTGKIDVSEDPFTVVAGSAEKAESQNVLLIWKLSAVLGRPRIRLQAPAIIFKVSASLQPSRPSRDKLSGSYLPDGVPLPSNILQPLEKDSSLHGVAPQISTLRLSRKPVASEAFREEVLPIKVLSGRPFRAIPVLSSRVKFQRPPFRIGKPSLIAGLELDIPGFAQHPVEILEAKLSLSNGVVDSLDSKEIQKLPILCHPRDSIVHLYSVSPNMSGDGEAPLPHASHFLEVTINVRVHVSDTCNPNVEIRFKANVDFSTSSRSTQASSKLSNAAASSGRSTGQLQTMPALQGAEGVSNDAKMGVIFQFNAQRDVHVGKPFKWEIFVINRSSRQRKLALTMLTKRKSSGEKRVSSMPASKNVTNKTVSVADSYVDNNFLYARTKSQAPESTQLICLNSDLRIGPLNPGACFTTEMEFLPLARGYLHMEGIRVTDLSTNESVDLYDLPDVIASERKESPDG